MFEDATFESTGRIHTRSRGWMVATFAFNSAVVLALALFPLLHPEALPRMWNSILMVAPPLQQQTAQLPPRAAQPRASQPSEIVRQHLQAPSVIPSKPYIPAAPEPPAIPDEMSGIGPSSGSDLGVFKGPGRNPAVRPAPQPAARISQGVMNGYLVWSVLPKYPPIAREAGIEGTVVLQAIISKTGTIENLRVVSGPAMLQQAARDAVSQWRYRPYLLNGEPVEVETTVNVQFTMH